MKLPDKYIDEDSSQDEIINNLISLINIIHDSDDIASLSTTTKTISIRGLHIKRIRIPFNYSLEKKRRKNLLANVGKEPLSPSIDLVD